MQQSIDRLQRFPNQNIEQRQTECCGETVADIWGNIQNAPQDAGFSYAAALSITYTPAVATKTPVDVSINTTVYINTQTFIN